MLHIGKEERNLKVERRGEDREERGEEDRTEKRNIKVIQVVSVP